MNTNVTRCSSAFHMTNAPNCSAMNRTSSILSSFTSMLDESMRGRLDCKNRRILVKRLAQVPDAL